MPLILGAGSVLPATPWAGSLDRKTAALGRRAKQGFRGLPV